jgi:cell division septation protein DedD
MVFKWLGLGAFLVGNIILLSLIVYHHFGSRPAPVPTGKLEEKPQTIPPKAAISPPTAKEHPLAPLEEGNKYGLLVGAFPDSGSAEEMLDKVREQGEQGFIRTTPGKKNGSQVIAGPFSSRREAYVAAISLKNKLHLETTIIPGSK